MSERKSLDHMMDIRDLDVKVGGTGRTFTGEETGQLAALIAKRWGDDIPAAAAAWRRLFQNSCTNNEFARLVAIGNGTYVA